MTTYQIVPATPLHVGPIARRMGAEARIIEASGGRVRRWMRWQLQNSSEAWVAIVDGEPCAIWGIWGGALEFEGRVWLVLTDKARQYRVTVVRGARAWLEYVGATRRLVSLVRASDERAQRFARFLGFTVWEDEPTMDSGVVCYPITKDAAA